MVRLGRRRRMPAGTPGRETMSLKDSFTPEEWARVMGGAHIVTGRACARVRFSIW